MADRARRLFLRGITVLAGGVVGGSVLVPGARFLADPAGRRVVVGSDELVDVAAADDVIEGRRPLRVEVLARVQRDAWAQARNVRVGAAWLVPGPAGPLALSATCPHLGCAIDLDAARAVFVCPCHASAFALDGSRRSGPAPRGMDPLDTVVEEGRVRLRFARFRLDTERRIRIG